MKLKKLLRRIIAIGFGAACFAVAGLAPAQTTTAEDAETSPSKKSMMETITEVFGEGGVELKTGEGGEIVQSTNEAGEIVSVSATKEVVLRSDKLNLDSDYLLIDTIAQKVLATGKIVKIKVQDTEAECGRFEYDIATKKSTLTENPRIVTGDANVKSEMIVIEEDATGKTSTRFIGSSALKIGGEKKSQTVTPTPNN